MRRSYDPTAASNCALAVHEGAIDEFIRPIGRAMALLLNPSDGWMPGGVAVEPIRRSYRLIRPSDELIRGNNVACF